MEKVESATALHENPTLLQTHLSTVASSGDNDLLFRLAVTIVLLAHPHSLDGSVLICLAHIYKLDDPRSLRGLIRQESGNAAGGASLGREYRSLAEYVCLPPFERELHTHFSSA